ncbi:MAG: EAL domain-containing protein [Pseudomonadota bacterium]
MTLPSTILILTVDVNDAKVVREVLSDSDVGAFTVEWLTTLSDTLNRLRQGRIAAILLDPFLTDSQGIETFEKLVTAVPHIPIVILIGAGYGEIAKHALQRGAQDYLEKNHIGSYLLPRAVRNVIVRREIETALFLERERAQITLNSIGDAVISVDMIGNIAFLNQVAEKTTGWTHAEAIGRPLDEIFRIIDEDTHAPAIAPLALAIRENAPVSLQVNGVLIRRDGMESAIEASAAPIHDLEGTIAGGVMIYRDITESRLLKRKMAHLAHHDVLTNLPNRLLLKDRITQAIAMAHRRNRRLAILFLDLDRFKYINDSLGHTVGDELLQQVAERLSAAVRESDTVSRQGGDEFVILLPDVEHVDDAAVRSEGIINRIATPYKIGERDLYITASIGISVYPDNGSDAETLIKYADTAMYCAKSGGRNNYQFFVQDMDDQNVARQSFESSLRQALDKEQFILQYQPKVILKTGEIIGAEALIRWQHPQWGLVPPDSFIPIAEEIGLIVSIGQWVLRHACRQLRTWRDAGGHPICVSVNVSASEFRGQHFLADVRAILAETRIEPHCLELELTESVLMESVESTDVVLRELKSMGVRLAIDDFGTGYSSLSYLSQFPIDVLKIDQSFVREIAVHPGNATIISAVVGMGKGFEHQVIAEGVETQEQAEFLQSRDCAQGQGYYFSRPVNANEFAQLLGTTLPH